MKPLILIVEDDPQIRRFLRAALEAEEYRLHECEGAKDALVQAAARQPDLILLDLGLPDGDGLDVIRTIREASQVPILVLSAREKERDKISALDLGADDYIAKPFAVGELLARIRAALRRSVLAGQESVGSVVQFGRVEVDLEKRIVRVDAEDVHLTPNEYHLLQALLRHPGKVLTHRQLLQEVWGPNQTEQGHYLRVYIAQLRKKLELDPARPRHLHTEPGVGYRLVIED